MARKSLANTNYVAKDQDNKGGKLKAALFKVDPSNITEVIGAPEGIFLLNPSSWEENKPINWASHNVPGQSDPILQWISGGARTINFDALITKDTADTPYLASLQSNPLKSIAEAGINAVGEIASNFFGVNVPNLVGFFGATQGEGEDLSIASNLTYYRSLAYPTYTADKMLVKSPPLLRLFVGKTFELDTFWILANYRIKITKQLPNLTPMEAVVSFQLVEYRMQSKSHTEFSPQSPTISDSSQNFIKSLF